MSVVIKRAGLNQLHEAAVLFDAYRIFYKQATDIQAATGFLQQRLLNTESIIFLAYADDKAVGFCQLYPLFSSVGLQRTWLLNDLYVDELARGKGVAAALLQAAKSFGIETNSRWLMLETAADNFTAQSVYEQNGWKKMDDVFYELWLG